MNITLKQTCSACPEQYDAFDENNQYCGYLRLRHGYFRVDDKNGNTIYEAEPRGDGIFKSEERDFYLNEAKKAIINSL